MFFSPTAAYNRYNVSRTPMLGGVYRLCQSNGSGGSTVFYVGQSSNLRQRLEDHLQASEQNRCIQNALATGSCYYDWALIQSQTGRDIAERNLINGYKPACNFR